MENTLLHLRKRLFLQLANGISSFLPPTRCFRIRSNLFRLAGLDVADNVRIVGGSKFHYSNISIGPGTWISAPCHFITSESASIIVGSNVDIAPGCFFNTGSHRIGDSERRAGQNIASTITVGDGSWIGMSSVILDGATIGAGCIVAAGAVVRGQFPDNVLIGGVPARIVKELRDKQINLDIT